MNTLLIVVGLIFLISVIVGAVRGFVKIVASLVSTIIIIVVVMIASPMVGAVIRDVTPIGQIIQDECMEIFAQGAEEEEDGILDHVLSREQQIDLIENANIPDFLQDLLLENNNDEIYAALGVTTFVEYVAAYITKLVTDMLAFLLTFLVVSIVVKSALYILGVIGELPVLGGFNHLGGGVLGLGIGLIVVWVLFVVITAIYDTSIGAKCFEDIRNSEILTILYNSNFILNNIVKF